MHFFMHNEWMEIFFIFHRPATLSDFHPISLKKQKIT